MSLMCNVNHYSETLGAKKSNADVFLYNRTGCVCCNILEGRHINVVLTRFCFKTCSRIEKHILEIGKHLTFMKSTLLHPLSLQC